MRLQLLFHWQHHIIIVVTVALSLATPHYNVVTVALSLATSDCNVVTVAISLATSDYFVATVALSLATPHYCGYSCSFIGNTTL